MMAIVTRVSSVGSMQVLMGDNATRLAVRLLGNVAQGRGRTLPLDTVRFRLLSSFSSFNPTSVQGFIDDRTADVAIIRPLRYD